MITYGFGTGLAGLANIGLGIGLLIATVFGAKFGDQLYHHVCPALATANLFSDARTR